MSTNYKKSKLLSTSYEGICSIYSLKPQQLEGIFKPNK